jgi:hypothetical protein
MLKKMPARNRGLLVCDLPPEDARAARCWSSAAQKDGWVKPLTSLEKRGASARNYLQSNVMQISWFVKDFWNILFDTFSSLCHPVSQKCSWPTNKEQNSRNIRL